MRSGSCSSSIVSIFPLVLILVPLNFGLEKASAFKGIREERFEEKLSNYKLNDAIRLFVYNLQRTCLA